MTIHIVDDTAVHADECPGCEIDRLRRALAQIAEQQQYALRVIRENGFVFVDIGREPGNWQHLAFTLYSTICEIDVWARGALDLAVGDPVDLANEAVGR